MYINNNSKTSTRKILIVIVMNHNVRLLNTTTQLTQNDRAALMVYVSNFLSPDECSRVVELSQSLSIHGGRVGPDGALQQIRNSTVQFLSPTPESEWLYSKFEAAILELNKGFQYDLKGFYEGMQVATYTSDGHYNWHSDFGRGVYSVRKLSFSVQLSNPEEYEGGELEFMASREPAPRQQGTLIAFPSFLVHRVRPVTQGKRMSLVSWISGPPFR